MSGPIAAVGTDTYSGLSGYKRPLQGNPTRVPGSLPAFRGVTNKPGSAVKTPAIKSSSNRPSRGTNITIPYARQTPLDHTNNLGRLAPGDVAFVSRDRPSIPGYAHSRYTRLLGVDALNRFMSAPFWGEKGGDGEFRHILTKDKANGNIADNWRTVPFLGEWSCDGIVMSSEAPEVWGSSGKLDSQLYNIVVQGICPTNNGYVDQSGVGQISRALASHVTDDTSKYTGANYHLYPLQMFDRDIGPLNELFVGLVAEKGYDAVTIDAIEALENTIKEAQQGKDDTKRNPQSADFIQFNRDLLDAERDLRTKYGDYKKTKDASKALNLDGEFYFFKFVFFTSRNAMELNINENGSNPDGADIFVPLQGRAIKRLKSEYDQYDSPGQRKADFGNMVGAWRIGKVIDVKAQKMPWFPSGPSETGYRVTTNVDIEWWDWRKLRRTYTNSADAEMQIGETLDGAARWGVIDEEDAGVQLMWPTMYDPKNPEAPKNPAEGNSHEGFKDVVLHPKATAAAPGAPAATGALPAFRAFRESQLQVLPELPESGATLEHHAARLGIARRNLQLMVSPMAASEVEEVRKFAALIPAASGASGASIGAPAGSSSGAASVAGNAARKQPMAPPQAAATSTASAAATAVPAAAVVAPPAAAASSGAAAVGAAAAEDGAVAPSPARGGRRARSATVAADVFSNIFGSSTGADASAPQPLNPQHRVSPGGGTTGRSFSRRKGARDSLDK